ncbi:hypothetical protein [Clostridium botulinum]|uniref:Uncharacterized protein n=1 Tax=Clostridium botulinum TaxID=1491 RepID=A0A1L7JMI2_CLOBO|nr:hypothetical protein [Clostridium botulinum]APU86967.1 hypothetical protein NPD8_4015 [Clostridium botulinum]
MIKRITWSQLNSQNLVAGKDFNIEGTDYKCRLLTGGNDGEGSSHFGDKGALDLDNEWDRYISMEYWMKFIDKFYNTSSIKSMVVGLIPIMAKDVLMAIMEVLMPIAKNFCF